MTYHANRETAEAIADESLIWAINAVDRYKGKGSAGHHPELIAAFAKVYVQSYTAGIFETLSAMAKEANGRTA
jgi:hypothetical protein